MAGRNETRCRASARRLFSAVLLASFFGSTGNAAEETIAKSATSTTPASAATSQPARLSPEELGQWIDAQLEAAKALPPRVDDATFLRRAWLDLAGAAPSVAETRDFLASRDAAKRAALVRRLLNDPRSTDHLSRVIRRWLLSGVGPMGTAAAPPLETWLREQWVDGLGYDELVRQLITADPPRERPGGGRRGRNEREEPEPTYWLQAAGPQPENLAGAASRVFLGVRIECAQCHDHPFTDWKQTDFWGLAAFFVSTGPGGPGRSPNDTPEAAIAIPEKGAVVKARFLGGAEIKLAEGRTPRDELAAWLTAEKNPYFAATAVNRVWESLCGQGLTSSVADLDQATPAERAVLDPLAALFVAHDYDLKWLIEGICASRAYQATSEREAAAQTPLRPLKVLAPEQVYAALEQALALPLARADGSPRFNGRRDEFVARLAEALSDRPTDFQAGVPQALILMNGPLTAEATNLESSRTLRAVVDAPFLQPYQKIETLYLAALTRQPQGPELQYFTEYVLRQPDDKARRQAYAEIFWALLNSPEFVLLR